MNTLKTKILFLLLVLLGVGQSAFAQEKLSVSGVVRDTKAVPLPNVQISVKGTSLSTYTDLQGRYAVEITKGQTLVFSLQGMTAQEVTPTSATADVILQRVGEVASSSESEEKGTPMNTNTRGQTSISGNARPLWILNGVILQGGVDLNPEDLVSDDAKMLIAAAIPGLTAESIESFRVLKDASATAIYGPRAIAGAVVVTTKRGSSGSSSITYTNESTYRFIPTYNQYNIMNSQDQMSIVQELLQAGYYQQQDVQTSSTKGVIGKMYDLYYQLDQNGNPRVANTEAGRAAYLRAAEMRNTNWFNQLFQNSIRQNHTLSFSSGNSKSSYYASLSFLSDPGWQKGNTTRQYAGNLNANYNISSKFTLNVITDISYDDRVSPILSPYTYALNRSRALDPKEYYTNNYAPYNIFNEIDNAIYDTNVATLRLQGQLTWKITPKVQAAVMGAIRYQDNTRNTEYKDDSNMAMSYREMSNSNIRQNNSRLYRDPNDPFALAEIVLPRGGIREKRQTTRYTTNFRATVRYNDTFKGGHTLSLFGGTEVDNTENTRDVNQDYGVLYNSGYYSSFYYLMFRKLQEENQDYYTITNRTTNNQAFFGNASYSYKNRYNFNGTLRYDASNMFGESRYVRWMPTWNTGVSWEVSREKFFSVFKPIALSYLNLKASFGVTAIAPSVSNSLSEIYTNQPFRNSLQNEIGLTITSPANHDLTYEKNQELNVGAELGFFKGRLNLSVEWFNRKSYDLIGDIITQGVSGFTTRRGNMAEMRTHGLEIGLETTNIKTKDFSWRTGFVYSRATNEVTKLLTNPRIRDMVGYSSSGPSTSGYAGEGYPLNSLFSVPFNGLNNEGLPTFLDANGNTTMSGINFDSSNVGFLKYSGTMTPTDKGNFSNTFTYKGISLGVVLTYSYGNVVRLRNLGSAGDLTTLPREMNDRWRLPGDENRTNIPVIYTTYTRQIYGYDELRYAITAYNYSDVRIAKGDNIRLKEISLGYTFDRQFLRDTRIRQLSMKLQATNVALLYADKKLNGDDPDFLATGTTITPKRLIFTLRVGL